MDEPILFVRDGAFVTRVPLTRLLFMYRQAMTLAQAVAARAQGAADAAEAVVRAAEQKDINAALSVWLLDDAMKAVEERRQKGAIVVAGTPSDSPTPPATSGVPAAPPTSVSSVGGACPVPHPDDVACSACAPGFLERRNAAKREKRAAQGLK